MKLYATAAETDSAAAELADGKALEDAVESGADAASDLASDLDAAAGDAKAEILAETDADVSVDAPAQTDVAEVVADSDAAEADAIGGADENGGADSAVDIAAACTPGGCDDGNPCTDDKCDPVVGCKTRQIAPLAMMAMVVRLAMFVWAGSVWLERGSCLGRRLVALARKSRTP